jgi:hypothetical protein
MPKSKSSLLRHNEFEASADEALCMAKLTKYLKQKLFGVEQLIFFVFLTYFNQQCLICRPYDSEPRTVAYFGTF